MIGPGRVHEFLTEDLWRIETQDRPWHVAAGVRGLRFVYVVARDISEGELTLRAMSLVYTSLLALVPLLAVSFSVLKAFGVHNQIEPMLMRVLAPLGEKGFEITERVITFVENMKVGVLGAIGVAFLFWTVVALMGKIERSFNEIWHVAEERALARRFSDYLSVLLIGPVLVFSALGVTASLTSSAIVQSLFSVSHVEDVVSIGARLVPYVLITAAFTFIYVFIPNTRVRLRYAFAGALVAGVLWATAGWAFASFVVASARYEAVYSAFATLILFMFWVYLCWLILLVGADVAFYAQHPEYITPRRRQPWLSPRMAEKVALMVMYVVGERYYRDEPAPDTDTLARRLRVHTEALAGVLEALRERRLLTQTADDPPAWIPGRPLDTTPVSAVLDAVRGGHEQQQFALSTLPRVEVVDEVLAASREAVGRRLEGRTVKSMVVPALPEPAASPGHDGSAKGES